MIELQYDLVVEATDEPDFFGFYSPELEGFSGIGHSVEDCLYQAKWGMREHLELLAGGGMPIPPRNESPTVVIRNMRRVPVEHGTHATAAGDITLMAVPTGLVPEVRALLARGGQDA